MDNEKQIRLYIRESINRALFEVGGRYNSNFQEQINSLFDKFTFRFEIKSDYQFSPEEQQKIKEDATFKVNQKLAQLETTGVEVFSQIIVFPLGNYYVKTNSIKNKITFYETGEKDIFPYDSVAAVVHEDTFKLLIPIDSVMPHRMLMDRIKNQIKSSRVIKNLKSLESLDINPEYNTPNIIVLGVPKAQLQTTQQREKQEMATSIRPDAVVLHPKFSFGKIIGFAGDREFVKVEFPADKGRFYTFYQRRRLSRGRPTAKTFEEYKELENDMVEKKFATNFFQNAAE